MKFNAWSILFQIIAAAVATGSIQGEAAEFLPLGDLPGGEFDSVTTDISDDGLIVAGFGVSEIGTEAFRWTEDAGLVALSSLTGEFVPTIARAVSDSGAIAGQLDYVETTQDMPQQCTVDAPMLSSAAVWTEDFGFLPIGGSALIAHDLSADGTAVTGTTCEFDEDPDTGEFFAFQRPFHWTEAGGLFVLEHAGEAFGISADGSVIAGFAPLLNDDDTFANQAFRWSQDLGDFAEPLSFPDVPVVSEAYDISADGEVIVGAYRPDESAVVEGFRWTEEAGYEGLGSLVDFPSFVFDTSADGSVIVGEQYLDDQGTQIVATLWSAQSGLVNLQTFLAEEMELGDALSDWTLTRANGISADGRSIVGFGTNPEGNTEAWLVRIDDLPPPSALDGDYNDNGQVEQADLDLVLLNWGQGFDTLPPDWVNQLPMEGIVDQAELDGVLLNWGNTTALAAGTATVPEPGTLMLAGLFLPWAAAGRRRNRRARTARSSPS